MPWKSYLPLIKFISSHAIPIMYIVGFASSTWVTTNASFNKAFGLWKWCYQKHSTDTRDVFFVNDTKCHSINPGDSPGYFEAVRTVACFTLVLHLLYFGSWKEGEGLGERKKPCVIALASMIGATVTLSILGACYKDDARWKNHGSSLGWCYWLVTACAVMDGVMCWVCWMVHEMSKNATPDTTVVANTTTTTTSTTTNTTTTTTNTTTPSRQNINSSTTPTSAGNRKMTASMTPVAGSGGGSSSSGATSSTGSNDHSRLAGASASATARPDTRESSETPFPILTLPEYSVTFEPWDGMPRDAPPSYEEVIGEGGTLPPPPPPPYITPESER